MITTQGAKIGVLIVASLASCGCQGVRSMFQISSDAPVPFFGLDFTLPNKLSATEPEQSQNKTGEHGQAAVVHLLPRENAPDSVSDADASEKSSVAASTGKARALAPYRPGTELAQADRATTPPAF